jgi:hypothetical protein
MDRADKIKQQKKESYLRNREKIIAKRRDDYLIAKNNQAVGDQFHTPGVKSLLIKNQVVNTDKLQWREGMKVPSYLEAVTNKSKTEGLNSSLYSTKHEANQQRNDSNFNAKYLRPPPTTQIMKPTFRDVINKEDIPEWKRNGNESTFKEKIDNRAQYNAGFF